MSIHSVTVRSQLLALVGGLVLFALCSLLRQAIQPHLTHNQIGGFSHVDWTLRPTWQIFGVLASLGFILCEIGALGGRALARSWLSSKSGAERSRDIKWEGWE